MARPTSTDYFHSMRFFVTTVTNGGLTPLPGSGPAAAGFNACTTPEVSQEAVEYKEGHFVYTRKFPGVPTMSDVTLSRGVALKDTALYTWMMTCVEGAPEYRTDVIITHYHRQALPGFQGIGKPSGDVIVTGLQPVSNRQYLLHEAFPIRCKIAGDLDATSSDVSISELDVSYENFTVVENLAP